MGVTTTETCFTFEFIFLPVEMAAAATEGEGGRQYLTHDGPQEGVKYPLQVLYIDGKSYT